MSDVELYRLKNRNVYALQFTKDNFELVKKFTNNKVSECMYYPILHCILIYKNMMLDIYEGDYIVKFFDNYRIYKQSEFMDIYEKE